MDSDLGKRLRELRKKVGFKQKDIAGMVGVAPFTISRWENNKNMPHRVFAKKIEEILNFKPRQRGEENSDIGEDNK